MTSGFETTGSETRGSRVRCCKSAANCSQICGARDLWRLYCRSWSEKKSGQLKVERNNKELLCMHVRQPAKVSHHNVISRSDALTPAIAGSRVSLRLSRRCSRPLFLPLSISAEACCGYSIFLEDIFSMVPLLFPILHNGQ